MSDETYIIVGRSGDCDVVLSDPTVSGRHARLSWEQGKVRVEDLGSANGTFAGGKRVESTLVRPGDAVRFGRASLPWADKQVRGFLRQGAGGDTIEGLTIPGRRFICGACGTRGVMPDGFRGGTLRCGACRARLSLGRPKPRRGPVFGLATAAVVLLVVGLGWWWSGSGSADPLRQAAERLGLPSAERKHSVPVGSPQEASIRAHTAPKLVTAIDITDPVTRNTAAKIAAGHQGPYHVGQVARLWSHVREKWRYVNDPRGHEY
ncbi:MAG: FHA domain-containing protein, partial [Polyangiales bacterium]